MKARAQSIGQLANTAGVNLETIRYYERIGLMPDPDRTAAGHRAYSNEHARRLTFIRRARELGFSLEDVRALLELAQPGKSSCDEVRVIASDHLKDVRRKIADLTRLERTLAETVKKCVGSRSLICPVLEVLVPGLDA
jgi:MerR family mercuric resistance operon transcriptional regulator